jgi:hypothetical protein
MSGGIAQLVAIGQQDAHIVGNPEISFFRSTFKRHTNFSQSVERQVIQGNVSANGMSSVRIERKGDLLSYVYLQPVNSNGTQADASITDWTTVIDKVELLVGGQVIDTQDSTFTSLIAPKILAQNLSKSRLGGLYEGGTASGFYPLRFFFCESWQNALPLVSLSYHDVELRITWGASAASYKWECYANFAYVDTQEREFFASQPQQIIIHQVQKAVASGQKVQELNLNHPVKCLVAGKASNDMAILDRHQQVEASNQRHRRRRLQVGAPELQHGHVLLPHVPRGQRHAEGSLLVPVLLGRQQGATDGFAQLLPPRQRAHRERHGALERQHLRHQLQHSQVGERYGWPTLF